MKIVVTGLGYVGLVTSACLAEKGNTIVCIDVDKNKIDMLKKGISPIYEENLEELLENNKSKIKYTLNKKSAYLNADIIFICVGTPLNSKGITNLKFLYNVIDDIIKYLSKKCIIVIKSTVPIGTNLKIESYINSRLKNGIKVEIASNPEFLSQGTAVNDTLNASRIVIGTHSKFAETKLKKIYSKFNKSVIISTDINSSEMIKYASNNFLALKLAYVNEVANLCEKTNANIESVTNGMGLDLRIGNKFLNAGIGYGGSCLPKDTRAFYSFAKEHDVNLNTIKSTIESNKSQKLKLIDKCKKYYKNFNNLNISILGLTFKPNTDDLRESPAIINIKYLIKQGANIKVWDPIIINKSKKININKIQYCKSIDETIENTDVCFIFTEWNEIKLYDISKFKKLMNQPIVLDGRNCFKLYKVEKEQIIYDSIGRKVINKITKSY